MNILNVYIPTSGNDMTTIVNNNEQLMITGAAPHSSVTVGHENQNHQNINHHEQDLKHMLILKC